MRKNCYFDYLWIDDFCDMLEKFILMENPQFHTYNAVSGQRIDLLTLANIVNEIAGSRSDIIVCNEGLANEYTAVNRRMREEFPNLKYTDIRDSIKQLYSWYQSIEEEIDIYSLIYG